MKTYAYIIAFAYFLTAMTGLAQAPQSPKLEKLDSGLALIIGSGGNIIVYDGGGSLLVVDSGDKNTAAEVKALIAGFSAKPIMNLVITHYHDDHTGGIEVIGKDAKVFCGQRCAQSLPKEHPRPVSNLVAFSVKTAIALDNDTVALIPLGPGHTAGDSVAVFPKAKVVACGDLFFNGIPPFIDVADGSDTANWIKIIRALAGEYPDFRFVPGHGPVGSAKDFLKMADYLGALRDEVGKAVKAGKTREQAQNEIKLEAFTLQEMGDFLTKKQNVGWVYDELTRKK